MQKINRESKFQVHTGLRLVAILNNWVGGEAHKLAPGDTFDIVTVYEKYNIILKNIATNAIASGCTLSNDSGLATRFRVAYKNEYKKGS